MLARLRLGVVTVLALMVAPTTAHSQPLGVLIDQGRFDEAVATLSAASPAEVEEAAVAFFAEGYQDGYQQDDYAYGIRAFVAAKQLPGLTPERHSQFDFWHGFSVYQIASMEAEPETLESARLTLPKFLQALSLLPGTEDYAMATGIDLEPILRVIRQKIVTQELLIERGR